MYLETVTALFANKPGFQPQILLCIFANFSAAADKLFVDPPELCLYKTPTFVVFISLNKPNFNYDDSVMHLRRH